MASPVDTIVYETSRQLNLTTYIATDESGNETFRSERAVIIYIPEADATYTLGGKTFTNLGWTAQEFDAALGAAAEFEKVLDIDVIVTRDPALEADAQITLVNLAPGALAPNILGTTYFQNLHDDRVIVLERGKEGWSIDGTQGLHPGGRPFHTLLHEIGHALGLDHPFEGEVLPDVDSAYDPGDVYGFNQTVFTNMAYADGWNDHPGHGNYYQSGNPASLMALDVAALQEMYGARETTETLGDDVYTLSRFTASYTEDGSRVYFSYEAETETFNYIHPTITTHSPDGAIPYEFVKFSSFELIVDTGGIDTIAAPDDYLDSAVINLNAASLNYEVGGAGFVSYSETAYGGFVIANGSVIENARGGDGDDSLTGNAANNVLEGQAGNDLIFGMDGDDVILGGLGADEIDAGAGEDVVVIEDDGARDTITLGAGRDRLNIASTQITSIAQSDLIADFETGPTGDLIDLSDIFFLAETFEFIASGDDAVLSLDFGDGHVSSALVLNGVAPGALTLENVSPAPRYEIFFGVSRTSPLASIAEGDNGDTTLSLTVTRDQADYAAVLDLEVLGAAELGVDFDGIPDAVSFASGQTESLITVTIAGDQDVEGDELITVRIAGANHIVAAQAELGEAQLLIVDDDAAAPAPDLLEAEDLILSGFVTETRTIASGDQVVSIFDSGGTSGVLQHVHSGAAGSYDLAITLHDENDGESTVEVVVNDVIIETLILNTNDAKGTVTTGNRRVFEVEGLDLETGDVLQLRAMQDGGEWVRIDTLALTPVEGDAPTPAPTPEPTPQPTTAPVLLEAEDLILSGFVTETRNIASGDQVVSIFDSGGTSGVLQHIHAGAAGSYDLAITLHDEDDGESTVEVVVNDVVIETLILNTNDAKGTVTSANRRVFEVEGLDLETGDVLQLRATQDGGEWVRIDTLALTPVEGDAPTPAPTPEPTPEPTPQPTTAPVLLEAEGLILSGFVTETRTIASGDQVVSIFDSGGTTGVLQHIHAGAAGSYDLAITLHDENDGESTVEVVLNDVVIETLILNTNDAKGTVTSANRRVFEVEGLDLGTGDVLQLRAMQDGGEWVRIDTLALTPVEGDAPTPAPTPEPTPEPTPQPTTAPVLLEAEGLILSGFVTETRTIASGDQVVSIFDSGGTTGVLQHIHAGAAGSYDLAITLHDENDGESVVEVVVNDIVIETLILNTNDAKGTVTSANRRVFEVEGLDLETGDVLQLRATQDGGEWVRIDTLALMPTASASVMREQDPAQSDFLLTSEALTSSDTSPPLPHFASSPATSSYDNAPVSSDDFIDRLETDLDLIQAQEGDYFIS